MRKNILFLSLFTTLVLLSFSFLNILFLSLDTFNENRQLVAIEFLLVIFLLCFLYYSYIQGNDSFYNIMGRSNCLYLWLVISGGVSLISSTFKFIGIIIFGPLIYEVKNLTEFVKLLLLFSGLDVALIFIFSFTFGVVMKVTSKDKNIETTEKNNL